MTPYSVLGVPESATDEEVRDAYKRLAQAHHPDRHPDDPHAGLRFQIIKEAYESILKVGITEQSREANEVRDIMLSAFTEVLKRGGATRPISACVKLLKSGYDNLNKAYEEAELGMNTAKKVKASFRFMKDEPNPLHGLLDGLVKKGEERMADLKRQRLRLDAAIKTFKDYADLAPDQVFQQLGQFGSASTQGNWTSSR